MIDDLDAAVRAVLAVLSPEEQAELRAVRESEVAGRWFWLWETRAALCARLCGNDEGRSSTILKAVWNQLNGQPLSHRLNPIQRAYACSSCGRETLAEVWDDADSNRAVLAPCRRRDCESEGRKRRHNAEANARFQRARALGLAFHEAYRDEGRGADPESLVALATSRFDADAEFRSLWYAVRGAPPSSTDAAWLRLWITENKARGPGPYR